MLCRSARVGTFKFLKVFSHEQLSCCGNADLALSREGNLNEGPQMEPGTSREVPSRARCPEPSGLREETPGEEARGGEGSAGMLKRRGAKENTAEEANVPRKDDEAVVEVTTEEQDDAGKYEEELDPRIQACYKAASVV